MRRGMYWIGIAWGLLLASSAAWAEVRTVWERSDGSSAGPAFKFQRVPPPSATDAAAAGTFEILTGRRDLNGAMLSALNDGRVPSEADEPAANFFFAAGTDGGRLLLDLKAPRAVRQVNTYSWHVRSRGPQVWRLWAADGAAKGFVARPGRRDDPAKSGWTLLASVDTRGKGRLRGGQYGVSVSDAAGGVIGTYRYLLLEASRTEANDPFGNTFFSEIDVIDGKRYDPPPPPPGREIVRVVGKYEITFDYSEMPELKPWFDAKLKPACVAWYPKIVQMLPSEGYQAPTRLSVTFRKNMKGVAYTAGRRVVCAGPWFRRNLEGEAVGAVVHELVHVVQQYRRVRGGQPNPGWLVEGVADYIRWFLFEPASRRPRPNPRRAKYTDSYRVTGAFLDYVTRSVDKGLVRKLNAAMRQGRYRADLWKEHTGKTLDELWADYIQTLRGS